MRKILIAAAALPLGLLLSCQDRVDAPAPAGSTLAADYVKGSAEGKYDAILDDFARTLAASMADASVRTLLHNETMKKMDGDFDVLYSQVANQSTSSGTTLAKTMQQAQLTHAAARTTQIESVIGTAPLLNISVPVHIDKWDASSYTPWVVILANEDKAQLKAYDKDGNIHWVDAKKAPNFPVIVVGQSERHTLSITGQAVTKKGLMNLPTNSKNLYQQPDDGSGGGGGGGGGTGSGGGADCTSLDYRNLSITGWYTGDLSVIESWARGTPEIRMRAFGVDQNGTKITAYGDPDRGNLWEPPHRSDIDGTWWNINDYLFYWDISRYGEELTFILHEEDGGSPKDITIPISYKAGGFNASTSITFRVDDGDDYVGYFPRRLPFCSGSTIGNETLKFRVTRSN